MKFPIKKRLENWKNNSRRGDISYIFAGFRSVIKDCIDGDVLAKKSGDTICPPIETEYVNLLSDPDFTKSVAQAKDYTCLDVVRLANLWNLIPLVGSGSFLEVGCFRGGTALHICNAMESRGIVEQFYSFDPFETGGFDKLDLCDNAFGPMDFTNTTCQDVARLLSAKSFANIVKGYFPNSAEGLDLREIAFCHLDVDVYEATRNSLEYLAPRLAPKGIIVMDDVDHRETPGVNRALAEFLTDHPSFLAIPMFPCQAILMSKSLW